MLAGVGQIGLSAAPLSRAGDLHGRVRIVERLCDAPPGRERRPADCCPPAAPPPYACYLEDRNARDRVELTFSEHLARLPGPAPVRGECPEPPVRTETTESTETSESRPGRAVYADPALRGPRLGDVSSVMSVPPPAPASLPARLDVTA
jgi:hypothetical protein